MPLSTDRCKAMTHTTTTGTPNDAPQPQSVPCDDLLAIGDRIRTQDNRITDQPMFCVQKLVADTGYDPCYCDNECWWNPELCEVAFDNEPEGDGWDGPFGYKLRWEDVMVAFTEQGCEEYLELDGHNIRHGAHQGKARIYVKSFNRCPEMITVREFLLANA